MELKERVAIVTGGARGIGKGIALEYARQGAKVVIADILEKDALETVAELEKIGGEARFVKADVARIEDIEKISTETLEHYGKIDILANIAGISRAGQIVDVSTNDWDAIMNVNLKGVFLCCKVIAKAMMKQQRGKIINIGSVAGRNAERGNVPYSITKAGVISLTQGLALELAEYNINVNALCPGAINTLLIQQIFKERAPVLGLTPDQLKAKFESGIPLQRMGEPNDIGRVACFLASDNSDYITGQCIVIDGGLELTRPGL